MVRSREKFPKEGEFIVGKVTDIHDQHVYVDLIDYEGLDTEDVARGMIHVSEISSRWVKNIRTHVRIGQRIVLRVLHVNPTKGHIDLSLRRVNSAQREVRMKEWKYALKYENLLQFLVDATDISLDDAYELIGFPILELFDSYQETIEELKENGEAILKDIKNVSEEVKKAFMQVIDENVEISTINIIGKIRISYTAENGIDLIKESLIDAKNVIKNPKETRKLSISYIAAPLYRLEIVSKDYLDAENILSEVLEVIEAKANKYEGTFEFIRD
ncbi:MAG: S1 RNA-binding domain-containing protein [Promethearchaeota archaeon]|nr:MAG: S1 RNA-binding domain-containing protein [Candidatus Lokiarchaeota archaeon]